MRIFLALWLLGQLALAPAAAETGHGVLTVSMTVLSSCEVRTNGGAPPGAAGAANHEADDVATVTCPVDYPFRASLGYKATTGMVAPGGDAALVFTGARRLELSWLSGAPERSAANAVKTLTISY